MSTLKQCPKSASPYKYCPLVFVHEDDMVLSYVYSLVDDFRRVQGNQSEEAKIIDKHACQITAYLNGRLHQAITQLKEK